MGSLLGVSQKCLYALRAMFELSLRYNNNDAVLTVADISLAQNIPPRFLEQIVSKLRTGGYFSSRRGSKGGYILSRPPATVSVGEIIRFIEGDDGLVECLRKNSRRHCPIEGACVFENLWKSAQAAISGVFDTTTFADLVEKHRQDRDGTDYCI